MTKQEALGTIDGHDLRVEIRGPSSDELPTGSDRVGSEELMARIECALAGVKADVEGEHE